MIRRMAALGLVAVVGTGVAAGQQTAGLEGLLGDLRSPATRTRVKALDALGSLGRTEAAVPIAALLADGSDAVQNEAIAALIELYTVRADLRERQWGPGTTGRSATLPEVAFEAGPLATIPAPVPGEALTGLSTVVRQDESLKTRLSAAYALGVLGAPAMGQFPPTALQPVMADLVGALTHPDAATRQVVARVIGRVFAQDHGQQAPIAVGDALITAMNDPDPLVRRWAMDSLGQLKYDRAVQALTERASFYGKGEEGAAALHALARIASPQSAPIFRAQLASSVPAFRVIAIEGLARSGDTSALAAISESAAASRQPNVALAAAFAQFLLGQSRDAVAIADALARRETLIQARVYLAEIAELRPDALHPLLRTPDPWTRRGTVELLGVSRAPAQEAALQPLLQDPAPEVIEATSEAIRRLKAHAALAASRQ